jgi:site-specific recombinase XerC
MEDQLMNRYLAYEAGEGKSAGVKISFRSIRTKVDKNGQPIQNEFLFTSSTGKPISRNALTQLLSKTFEKYLGKKISTTLLRKIYMSSKYSDTQKEMEKDAEILGHSKATGALVYTKSKE